MNEKKEIWKLNKVENVIEKHFASKVEEPSALEIYNAEFKSIALDKKPSYFLPEIKFSKIPLDFHLFIHAIESNSLPNLKISIITKENQEISQDVFKLKDYIISNDKWYPLIPNKIEETQSWLKSINIFSGDINLSDLLRLKFLISSQSLFSLVVSENVEDLLKKNTSLILPQGLKAQLYPYQTKGYSWLRFIASQHLGAVLADEMGLGKTLQVIALLLWEKQMGNPSSIVIAPATLLENWRRELEKFGPSLTSLVHRGPNRTGFSSRFNNFDVIITSYDTLVSDLSMFKMISWNILIADEAQAIKNPDALRTVSLKTINRKVTLAVSGTPFENHISDLWSLTDFVVPGLLGGYNEFSNHYSDDIEGAKLIEPVISPIVLRRSVSEVATDLPDRIDINQYLEMSEEMADLYEVTRLGVIRDYGKNASLVALGKLKMFCCDPSLVLPGYSLENIKLVRLMEILADIFQLKEKVLIFTSYRKMESIIYKLIEARYGVYCQIIDGSVPVERRQKIVDEFSAELGAAALVLNPKAAGTGLNIVAANHVVHYNLDWNPALEDQASARSHRRGQDKPVRIYRLIYISTVEEVIAERLVIKREMATTAITNTDLEDYKVKDLLTAINISPKNRRL